MNNQAHQFNMDNAVDNFTVVDLTEEKIETNGSKKQEYKNPKNKRSDFKEDI